MITNFKLFEYERFNTDPRKYKVGDYVLISSQTYVTENDISVKLIRELHFPGSGDFECVFGDGYNGVTNFTQIKRLLTTEEIDKFKIRIQSDKYNI